MLKLTHFKLVFFLVTILFLCLWQKGVVADSCQEMASSKAGDVWLDFFNGCLKKENAQANITLFINFFKNRSQNGKYQSHSHLTEFFVRIYVLKLTPPSNICEVVELLDKEKKQTLQRVYEYWYREFDCTNQEVNGNERDEDNVSIPNRTDPNKTDPNRTYVNWLFVILTIIVNTLITLLIIAGYHYKWIHPLR